VLLQPRTSPRCTRAAAAPSAGSCAGWALRGKPGAGIEAAFPATPAGSFGTSSLSGKGRAAAAGITPAVGRVGHRHGPARPFGDIERESPLVVACLASIRAQRIFGALTADSHDAAPRHRLAARLRESAWVRKSAWLQECPWLRGAAWLREPATLGETAWLRQSASGALRRGSLGGCSRNAGSGLPSDRQDDELAVLRHRVLVFLAQKPALDEHVDARRPGIRVVLVLVFEESNRARVLLAAPDELSFLLAASLMPPDRHGDRHQNRHNSQRDQQGGHRVTPLAALTT